MRLAIRQGSGKKEEAGHVVGVDFEKCYVIRSKHGRRAVQDIGGDEFI